MANSRAVPSVAGRFDMQEQHNAVGRVGVRQRALDICQMLFAVARLQPRLPTPSLPFPTQPGAEDIGVRGTTLSTCIPTCRMLVGWLDLSFQPPFYPRIARWPDRRPRGTGRSRIHTNLLRQRHRKPFTIWLEPGEVDGSASKWAVISGRASVLVIFHVCGATI